MHACGVPESLMTDRRAQWPRRCMSLKFFARFNGLRGLSPEQFLEVTKYGCGQASKASGLDIVWVGNKAEAQIEMRSEPMGGSTLAYAYFPRGVCNEQLSMRFNSRVNWSRDLYLDTLVHEMGHNFGLPHQSSQRDIMYWSSTGRKHDGLFGHQSGPEMVIRYGPYVEPNPVPGDDDSWGPGITPEDW